MKQTVEWISTSEIERLPQYGIPILVCIAWNRVEMVYREHRAKTPRTQETWVWCDMDSGDAYEYEQSEVTHWMPKPDLPVKE